MYNNNNNSYVSGHTQYGHWDSVMPVCQHFTDKMSEDILTSVDEIAEFF